MMMIPPVYTCITTVICFQPRSTIIYKRRQLCSLLKLAMASSETGIENLSREVCCIFNYNSVFKQLFLEDTSFNN